MEFRRRNIVVQVRRFLQKRNETKRSILISEAETESINRELEQQFNESLQSKINHTHHGGLGFHGDSTSASSSGDWQHQAPTTKFIAAKTDAGASVEHVKVDEQNEKVADTSNDKSEEKKKKKSKS